MEKFFLQKRNENNPKTEKSSMKYTNQDGLHNFGFTFSNSFLYLVFIS